MSTSEKIEELLSYSRILYERKLLHSTGGNTSVRDGDAVWISRTGAELGTLTRDQVVKVDLQGTIIEGEAPSKEMGMHLAMYRARPEAGAVIHAHPTFSITYSTLVEEESDKPHLCRRTSLMDIAPTICALSTPCGRTCFRIEGRSVQRPGSSHRRGAASCIRRNNT